jgi:uncharacterized DUF497 family protein
MYECTYPRLVDFEWDPRKAAANLKKHEVDFADAALVLYDDLALTTKDPGDDEEPRGRRRRALRYHRGRPSGSLIYTWRGERARIISARQATSAERRQYEGKR